MMRPLILGVIFLVLWCAGVQLQADTNSIYPVTPADKAFFELIRSSILSTNIESLSQAISYPILVRTGSRELKLRSKKDLKEQAAFIFSARLKAVVQKQSPDELFKNWQGVMVGDGEIWFSPVGEGSGSEHRWVYRILALNLMPPPSRR